MLTLCGFAASNYYNKVKLVLLEKGIAFDESLVWAGSKDAAFLANTPLGKLPYIETDDGVVSESQPICEYLEATHPKPPLIPADPFAAAKVREIIGFTELYVEWEARKLYPEAFFGASLGDKFKEHVAMQLEKSVAAFGRLVSFGPFAAGEMFSLADCALAVHLPLVGLATKAVLGRDVFEGTQVKAYVAMMSERPSVQKVNADRKINTEMMLARAGR